MYIQFALIQNHYKTFEHSTKIMYTLQNHQLSLARTSDYIFLYYTTSDYIFPARTSSLGNNVFLYVISQTEGPLWESIFRGPCNHDRGQYFPIRTYHIWKISYLFSFALFIYIFTFSEGFRFFAAGFRQRGTVRALKFWTAR